jgi:hypothetical protein
MCFGRAFPFAGLMMLGWATLAVVLAALTSWWVLFALIPLGMMGCMAMMMGTMARSAGGDPRTGLWGQCSNAWFTPPKREVTQPPVLNGDAEADASPESRLVQQKGGTR